MTSRHVPSNPAAGQESRDPFVTTRWTVVLAAGDRASPDSDRALAELCQTYWYPLYAYVRRRGHPKEEAEDLVQSFFASFLARNSLAGLRSDRGRFRAFLLASLKHFLANEWDRANRRKRGGGIPHLSLDWQRAADRYHLDPPDPASPDRLFDREWALALLGRVIERLEVESVAAGRSAVFAQARTFLTATAEAGSQARAAAQLGMDEGAFRVAVHRLRRRYRQLLREEIAQTLADPSSVDEELRSLRAALNG